MPRRNAKPKPTDRVYHELVRQRQARTDGLFNLIKLWDAAGRPRNRSPRHWDAIQARRGRARSILPFAGVGNPFAAQSDEAGALRYAAYLDRRLASLARSRDPEPVGTPKPFGDVCREAVEAVAAEKGISQEEAAELMGKTMCSLLREWGDNVVAELQAESEQSSVRSSKAREDAVEGGG